MGSASNAKSLFLFLFFFRLEELLVLMFMFLSVYVIVCGRERKCKTFMKGSEEDDVARTLFQTSAFGLVVILLTLVLIL